MKRETLRWFSDNRSTIAVTTIGGALAILVAAIVAGLWGSLVGERDAADDESGRVTPIPTTPISVDEPPMDTTTTILAGSDSNPSPTVESTTSLVLEGTTSPSQSGPERNTTDSEQSAAVTTTVVSARSTPAGADDVPGSPVEVGETISSAVDAGTRPVEVFSLELVRAETILFEISAPSLWKVEIYNPGTASIQRAEPNQVAASWPMQLTDTQREFTPAVDGIYSVAIWANAGAELYDLTTTVI